MDRDKTEPEGKGSMNGRGRGFCIDFEIPQIEFPESVNDFDGLGRRFGFGLQGFDRDFGRFFRRFGRGMGFERRFRFHIQPREFSREEQIKLLKDQKKAFEDQVKVFEDKVKVFEERALAIGKQLKEFEKPLKNKRGGKK